MSKNKPFKIEEGRLKSFNPGDEPLDHIVIPEGVTQICSNVFANSQIRSVVFPSTLLKIDSQAFKNCRNLTSIIFNSDLKLLGSESFYNCVSLEVVKLPDIERTSSGVFKNCTKLSFIDISGLQKIPSSMFASCKNLNRLIVNDEIYSIGHRAFYDCKNLKKVAFRKVQNIELAAFELSAVSILSFSNFPNCSKKSFDRVKECSFFVGDDAFHSIDGFVAACSAFYSKPIEIDKLIESDVPLSVLNKLFSNSKSEENYDR